MQYIPRNDLRLYEVLKLQVQPQAEDRDGTAVAVVGRVLNELIVGGEMREARQADIVICFEDLLGPGIRQLTVADDHAEAARGEVQFSLVRDSVYCAG